MWIQNHQSILKLLGESQMRNKIFPRYLPTNYLLIAKGKIAALQWRDLTEAILTKWAEFVSSTLGQVDITHFMTWCTEKNTASLLQAFHPKMRNVYSQGMSGAQTEDDSTEWLAYNLQK